MRNEKLRDQYRDAAVLRTLGAFDVSVPGIAGLRNRINATESGHLFETHQVQRPAPLTFGDKLRRFFNDAISLEEQFLLRPEDIKSSPGFARIKEALAKSGVTVDVNHTTSVFVDGDGFLYSNASVRFLFTKTEGPTPQQQAFRAQHLAPKNG